MLRLSRSLGLLSVASLALTLCAPSPAAACGGGGFYQTVSSSETVGTTGHRVVISLSKTQTVLWDQMQFKGDPKDFAWVYPVKTGARLEVASDAWTEALSAVTTKRIQSPVIQCGTPNYETPHSGCNLSCAPGGARSGGDGVQNVGGDQSNDVKVVHSETIGPYDTQTIQSSVPGAIAKWLTDNGYKVPAEVTPILDDYAKNGFDFIALRLTPGKGVQQMQPVRVVTPGPTTTFPMRMLSAGAGDHVALDITVLTEGRVSVDGFSNAEILDSDVVWDFDSNSSNYASLRAAALAKDGGAVFLTSYAFQGDLFGESGQDPNSTVANKYLAQVEKLGEGTCDLPVLDQLRDPDAANGKFTVVDTCDASGNCTDAGPNEIAAKDLSCDKAKDLATALIGMHPADVWITHLEANLPKSALTKDLVLAPVQSKSEIPAYVNAVEHKGDACASAVAAPLSDSPPRPRSPLPPGSLGMIGAGLLFGLASVRRLFRSRAIA